MPMLGAFHDGGNPYKERSLMFSVADVDKCTQINVANSVKSKTGMKAFDLWIIDPKYTQKELEKCKDPKALNLTHKLGPKETFKPFGIKAGGAIYAKPKGWKPAGGGGAPATPAKTPTPAEASPPASAPPTPKAPEAPKAPPAPPAAQKAPPVPPVAPKAPAPPPTPPKAPEAPKAPPAPPTAPEAPKAPPSPPKAPEAPKAPPAPPKSPEAPKAPPAPPAAPKTPASPKTPAPPAAPKAPAAPEKKEEPPAAPPAPKAAAPPPAAEPKPTPTPAAAAPRAAAPKPDLPPAPAAGAAPAAAPAVASPKAAVPQVSTDGIQVTPLPVIDYSKLPMSSVTVPDMPRFSQKPIGPSRDVPSDAAEREKRYRHLLNEMNQMKEEREAEKEAHARLLLRERIEMQDKVKELRDIQTELHELTTDAFSHLVSGIRNAAGQGTSPPQRSSSPGVTAAHQQVLHDTVQDVLTKQQQDIQQQALQQQALRDQAVQQQQYLQQQHSALQAQQQALSQHQAMIEHNQARLSGRGGRGSSPAVQSVASAKLGRSPQTQGVEQAPPMAYAQMQPQGQFSPRQDDDVRARLEHLTSAVERTREDIAMLASMPQDRWRNGKQQTMVDMSYFADGRRQSQSPHAYHPAAAPQQPPYSPSPAAQYGRVGGGYGSPHHASPHAYGGSPQAAAYPPSLQHLQRPVTQSPVERLSKDMYELPNKRGVSEQEVNDAFVKMLHLRCIRDKALLSEMETTSTMQSLGIAAGAPPTATGTAAMLIPESHASPLRSHGASPQQSTSQRRQRWGQ